MYSGLCTFVIVCEICSLVLPLMPSFTPLVSSKLPTVGLTIFTQMSKLATEHQAINLAQGFPGFDCAAGLISLVEKYLRKGLNQYAPMQGVLALREVIAEKTESLYRTAYHPETEVTITAGATQAIFTAITALVKPGDEVLVIEPAYDCYVPAIELAGGKAVFFQLDPEDWTINWGRLRALVNDNTRMILLNSPHNPTGSTLSANDLLQLELLTRDTNIVILSDEVYEHITFDNQIHQSVARNPQLATRSIIVSSFGKTFHTTGWKLGYCIAPKELMVEFRKVHQFLVFSVNTPMQYAFAEYLSDASSYNYLSLFYQEKRDFFNHLVQSTRFKVKPSSGTYFQLLDYRELSDENDIDFARKLTIENGVASIPVSAFYRHAPEQKQLRFCFAKDNEELERAVLKLQKL